MPPQLPVPAGLDVLLVEQEVVGRDESAVQVSRPSPACTWAADRHRADVLAPQMQTSSARTLLFVQTA